jgi:phosphoenolpyruvate carboxylase
MRTLHSSGRSAAEIERAMLELDVRPVLTAHPTESTRRTLLAQMPWGLSVHVLFPLERQVARRQFR